MPGCTISIPGATGLHYVNLINPQINVANTFQQTLDEAVTQLVNVSDSPLLDAQLLLAHVTAKHTTYFYTWPDKQISDEEALDFQKLLVRRAKGEPIAHILGEREFWSLKLKVTSATLIPRPDTELLVELALQRIPADAEWQIVDLGTGSGAIALAIASERPLCHLVATDQSVDALTVAKENAARNKIENVEFLHSDWFAELTHRQFEMVVSNPPYICDNDPHLQQGDVRFEPRTALTSGADGLKDIRIIIQHSFAHLTPEGLLLIEHGYDQAEAVSKLLAQAGFEQVDDFQDYAGNPRVAVGRKSSNC